MRFWVQKTALDRVLHCKRTALKEECLYRAIGQKSMFHFSFYLLWINNFELGLPCLYSNFRFSLKPRDIKIKFDIPFPQVVNVFPNIYYFIKNKTTICAKERNCKYVHITFQSLFFSTS